MSLRWEEKMFKNIEKTSDKYINIKDLQFGKVISINPLEIDSEGLALYQNNLYINEDLLEHTREFESLTGTIGGSTTTISNGSITFKGKLKAGDTVVLKEINTIKYMLICKVTGV